MVIKDKRIGNIIIMPHPDPPPFFFPAHDNAQIYKAREYNVNDVKSSRYKARFNDDRDKTMLEDTKRVDTLKIEDSKLMDRYDAREYKHSRPWSDSALFYRDYPRI